MAAGAALFLTTLFLMGGIYPGYALALGLSFYLFVRGIGEIDWND